MAEKRRFQRTDFETSGTLIVGDRAIPFTVIDLSLRGALVNPRDPEAVKMGAGARLRIDLSQTNISIEADGKLVHREYNYLGFRFTMIDADSMAHLRRLLELNLGDDAEIDHELSFLADRSADS
jgi:hypothetical protein